MTTHNVSSSSQNLCKLTNLIQQFKTLFFFQAHLLGVISSSIQSLSSRDPFAPKLSRLTTFSTCASHTTQLSQPQQHHTISKQLSQHSRVLQIETFSLIGFMFLLLYCSESTLHLLKCFLVVFFFSLPVSTGGIF